MADDEDEENKPLHLASTEAWERHLLRDHSVVYNLFQGQQRFGIECPDCHKQSTKFDPFMYLSVPIPIQTERAVKVGRDAEPFIEG